MEKIGGIADRQLHKLVDRMRISPLAEQPPQRDEERRLQCERVQRPKSGKFVERLVDFLVGAREVVDRHLRVVALNCGLDDPADHVVNALVLGFVQHRNHSMRDSREGRAMERQSAARLW